LAQTALAGRTLDAASVRRHASVSVDTVTAWLVDLQRATRGDALGTAGVASRVVEPAAAALRRVRGDGLAAELAATCARLGPELASCRTVFEHGDLGAPNVLIEPGTQRLGVVDWECADARGLPAADLVFFLAFVAAAHAGARTLAEHVAAYDGAFLAPRVGADAWARARLIAHARTLDIPIAALPQIVVATWMRATQRAIERSAALPGEIESTAPGIARVLALWRRTLERFDALEF
jgi:aminoglycoside phosphotransferase (APT) family kinase protein